jgi:hypothetical protein
MFNQCQTRSLYIHESKKFVCLCQGQKCWVVQNYGGSKNVGNQNLFGVKILLGVTKFWGSKILGAQTKFESNKFWWLKIC